MHENAKKFTEKLAELQPLVGIEVNTFAVDTNIDSKLTWNDHMQRIVTKSTFCTEICVTAQVVLSVIVTKVW